jgi:signal transduction histidine kinase
MRIESTENLYQLLREEAALRRVAMLMAREVPQRMVFEAVAAEASDLIAPAQVRLARIDDGTELDDAIAKIAREAGADCAVGVPIVVAGTTWGALVAVSPEPGPLAAGSIARLGDFSQLAASAITSVQAREELRALADQQGALRRVATLVAQSAEPRAVFTAVAVEAARILGVGAVSLIRYDAEAGILTKIFGTHGKRAAVPDGGQWPLADGPEAGPVIATGRPARIDDWTSMPGPVAARHVEQGFGQAVAAPIIVDGAIWGLISAFGEADEILPPGCELRLADFTHLMASAISNAQARDELRGLAEQQGAALRRVATLVAQQAAPSTIFNAVAGEASRALGVPRVDVGRCHEDGSVTLLGSTARSGGPDHHVFTRSGERVAGKVKQTGRAARIDNWEASPSAGQAVGEQGFGSVVGAPIMVEGTLWGVIVVLADEVLHDDTETRLTDFTHLVASSISNVHARDNLIASRARIVTASDETRRRIERNLHDGIQQRVVALALNLRAVRAVSPLPNEVQAALDDVARDLEGVLEEIRVFSQGLHPMLLSRSGLGPSLRALARRSPIPVRLDVAGSPRFPEPVEIAIYYVVSEALANAVKHSQASEVSVTVISDTSGVRVTAADDGAGGAVLGRGSGLIGLVDRVEALGGKFTLDSPVGQGTVIAIELPLGSPPTDERAPL